jgi:hypothetical protein
MRTGGTTVKKIITMFVGLLVLCPAVTPQNSPSKDKTAAVDFVRIVNTAEMTAKFKEGSYVPLTVLIKQKYLEQAGKGQFAGTYNALVLDSVEKALSGYEMDLVTTDGGKGYRLILRQSGVQCGANFVSTEKGLIYEATALGCDKKMAKAQKPDSK